MSGAKALEVLYREIDDPQKEITLVREGIGIRLAEIFLEENSFATKDILRSLDISASTFFSKAKNKKARLNRDMTEKFVRLIQVMKHARKIIGNTDGRAWLYREIPSLGNQRPVDLLDTEPGHKLVEQTLLQIEYGVYG